MQREKDDNYKVFIMQLALLTHTERKTITIRSLSVLQREKDDNCKVSVCSAERERR